MENRSLWYLENINLSKFFCVNKMSEYADGHPFQVFEKGDFMYMPEDASDSIFFIADGSVKIGSYSDNGKEITKVILSKGEVFGELALIGEHKRRDYAQALEKTSVCILKEKDLSSLIKDHSSLSLFFMKIMGSRMLELENRLESLVFKDSRSRIIEYVLETNEKKGQRIGYEYVVRGMLTHQEIANLTATSRQTVTTVLNELRTKNLLTFDRRRILIRDLDNLKAELKTSV